MKVIRGFLCALLALAACAPQAPPPLGEAILVVDTDLAVPALVNGLLIDIYTADGSRWYESREIGRPDAHDWPVSFSVYDPSTDTPRSVLVRLRAFPLGITRDYRGERYSPRPTSGAPGDFAPFPAIRDGEPPRLRDSSGVDRTPPSEPHPLVTVDRLVLVPLVPGRRGTVRIVLRGSCVGTMANLSKRTTCVDKENVRIPVDDAIIDPDTSQPTQSLQGSFAPAKRCTAELRPATTAADGTPLFDDEVCLPGGAFLFGNVEQDSRGDYSDAPVRVAVLPPFRMDRYEVSVGRWRAALAAGFINADNTPLANEAPIIRAPNQIRECSWSISSQKRETLPLTCVSRDAARAFCQFYGGDLPTEAQWEYAAEAAGRDTRTPFPWGNEFPDCDRAVYARDSSGDTWIKVCAYKGFGPQPVDAANDVAASGLVGLAGSVSEITFDSWHSFLSICWATNGLDSPRCVDDAPMADGSERGGHWRGNEFDVRNGWREPYPHDFVTSTVGFRCVRTVE